MDDRWSNLTDINFKYESDSSLFGTEQLVIKELSVNGGTIYADWDPDESEVDFDPDDFSDELDEIGAEFEELGDEIREEVGNAPGLRELRIDLVSLANLKIVNPATQLEITVDELKFEGLVWQKGDLQNLGNLIVRSNQMELNTVPSVVFSEMKNSERFQGTLRAQADHRLKSDVPFVFDFAVNDDLSVFQSSELFDGQLRFIDDSTQTTLSYHDFSPAEFIDLKTGAALPSNVNMELAYGENKKQGPQNVNSNGAFEFGKTRFGDLRIIQNENNQPIVVAEGVVNGETVRAFVEIDAPFSPWWSITLESENHDSLEDLWADTIFGGAFAQLAEEEQNVIRASMPAQKVVNSDDGNAEETPEEQVQTGKSVGSEATSSN